MAATAEKERRSLEDAGRALRYRALARLAKAGGFTKVAVGHHQDDNAETLLLHLLRGTTAKGLAGIPPKRGLTGCRAELVRPLMALTREEVRDYCLANRLSWREDASNRCEDFTRNWVRRRLIPLMETKSPRLLEHLARISQDVRRGSYRPQRRSNSSIAASALASAVRSRGVSGSAPPSSRSARTPL